MNEEQLLAEVERLRNEVEAYKQRELESLKTRLAAAELAAAHYKAECDRIAAQGRAIHAQYQEEVGRLRLSIQSQQVVPNTRVK